MGLLLNITASILMWAFLPILRISGYILSIKNKEFNAWQKDLAISKDQYGNVVGKYLFNLLLIKKDGYQFGKPDEFISSVIGKNKELGTLSRLGKILDSILNRLDENHSIDAIEEDE